MRVAFVSYEFGEYSLRLVSGLSRLADVLLLLPRQVAEPHLSALEPHVRYEPFDQPRLRQLHRQLRLGWDLVHRIRAFDPDVVHLQHGHLWFNGFLPLLRRYPLVVTVHDARHHPGDRVSRKTPQTVLDFGFRRAARLIAHAREPKEVLVHACGVPPDRVDVVPHVSLIDTPPQAPPSDATPTILFFGRIWAYKGLEYLIRAEPLITTEVPEVDIVIAGRGENFARYRGMMTNPDRFTVHNEYLSNERRNELFQRATVVVLPYVEASQSGVIPLAYAFMKPVVATRTGGLAEFVEDGRTGYLVPPRDARALASAVVRLLRNRSLCRDMGMNGRRKLDLECAPAVVAHQTLAVYHRTLAARPSSIRLQTTV